MYKILNLFSLEYKPHPNPHSKLFLPKTDYFKLVQTLFIDIMIKYKSDVLIRWDGRKVQYYWKEI